MNMRERLAEAIIGALNDERGMRDTLAWLGDTKIDRMMQSAVDAILDELEKPDDGMIDAGAQSLIDTDSTFSGYHELHMERFRPRSGPSFTAAIRSIRAQRGE